MNPARVALAAALLITAAIVQVTVVNRLGLPGGGPDLVLLVVASLAVVQGSLAGAVTGFVGGLLVDLVPPAAGPFGLSALVLCLVGYLAGMLRSDTRRSPVLVVSVVVLLSGLAVLVALGVGMLFGESAPPGRELTSVLLGTVLYDLLLAPFVVPAVIWLARRAEPDPNRLSL